MISGLYTYEQVLAGAASSNGDVYSGGTEYVSAGGVANGMFVYAGGDEVLFGTASGTLLSGGVLTVHAGATATSASVRSGGEAIISAGGLGIGLIVGSSGAGIVLSGGVASAATVGVGGTLTVSSGGSLTGGLTLSAGKAAINGTVMAGQTVTYAGTGGDLVLGATASFAASISGFTGTTDKIDLTFFTYNSATETKSFTEAASKTSGTLTVASGGKTESLTLLGSYVTSNFVLSNDGSGGTLIVDPPVKHHATAAIPAPDFRDLFGAGALREHGPVAAAAGDTASRLAFGAWQPFMTKDFMIGLFPRHPA